jgi:hypothetical protein
MSNLIENARRRGIPIARNELANIERGAELTTSTVADIYGCCGVFDLCGDADLISLSLAAPDGFLDWVGWETTDLCVIERNFIDRVIPSEETRQGWVSDACATPNTVNWATCAFRIEDFGRLRRGAPVQDVTKNHLRLCESQVRYRRDGTPIQDDLEYRAVITAEVMLQDLKLMLIEGNTTTAGQFDGLEQLVRVGYTDFKGRRCSLMDSIVVNWNFNTLAGGAGMTWTDGRGTRNISASATFTDVLRSIMRIVKTRIKNSGLGAMNLQFGDIAIICTSEMAEAILDQYTCWSVCEGGQFNEANINTLEARSFRENLMGGVVNANGNNIQVEGIVTIHGMQIPVLSYDWGLQSGSYSDVYVLTGSVGGRKTLTGQWNDMRQVPVRYENANKYFSTDGGRALGWFENDQACVQQIQEMQPRLVSWAPWTNVRISNVNAETPGGHMTFDPLNTSFFPGTSFSIAVCD